MGQSDPKPPSGVVIASVPDARRREALELLTGTATAEPFPGEIFAAYQDERLLAVTGVEFSPGRTANLIRPRFVSAVPPGTSQALFHAALEAAWLRDAVLMQALSESDSSVETQELRNAGFRHIADLLYLVSTPESFPERRPSVPLALRKFDEPERPWLAKLIERTYEGTCDCPVLNGVRTAEDVVAGYRAVGDFRRENWLIASDGKRDVGCLLLADHSAYDQIELVYLGVIPEARGRGLGFALTRHAQWMSREAGRGKLVLAVDADNAPALRLYAEAGFQSWDRRSVWVALRPDSPMR